MTKTFKTIDEQIDLLKSRGMKIEANERRNVGKLLLRSNYYDVVNGYGRFFQMQIDKFRPESNFQELYAVYMYDKNIKSIFFRKIQKAEAFIRSAVAYYFSKNHQEDWSFLHSENFLDKPLEVAHLFSKIESCINHNKRYPNAISHYSKRGEAIPLWVLINFFEFGITRSFLKLMRDIDKIEIANYVYTHLKETYNLDLRVTPKQIDSYLQNINKVRNIVAHDNRLLGFKPRKASMLDQDINGIFINPDRKSVFYVYLSMRLFLSKGQLENFTNALKSRTKDLNKKLVSISIDDIVSSISFPEIWRTETFENMFL